MEVALQENLKYQLELLHFGFIQQQQSYLPFLPSPLFYHNFTMAASEETKTFMAEEMSPNGDSLAQIALPAAGTIVSQVPKPPRVVVRCDVCDLSFSSPSVFDSHMAGSKHQKKVKSAELLKSMESMNHEFERNEISGVIRCIVCDITVNSPQLLATHMAGNKHRANAQKRNRQDDGSAGPPAKRPCVDGEEPVDATSADGADALGAKKKKKKKKKSATEAAAGTEGTAPEDFKLPDFVSKLESEHGCYYFCNTCNAHCNSQLQLSQHLSSKKHGDKMRELSDGPTARGRRGRGGFRSGPWGSSETPAGSTPFRGRGRGVRGERGRGFFGDTRGRGGRGFFSGRGGNAFMGRGRGGENNNDRGDFHGSFRGPPRGPLRGSSRGAPGFATPWADFRGRGRGRAVAGPHAVGSGYQPDAGWGEERWTPASQATSIENRFSHAPNDWYDNNNGRETGAGQGVKRSYDDSCAENPYLNHTWAENFNEADASTWSNTSASDGGTGAPSSYEERANALPRRNLRGGFSDSRGGNFTAENYNRGGEQGGDTSKYVAGGASNYGGFDNYGAISPSDYAAGGTSNYDAGSSNQYCTSGSTGFAAGGVSSFGSGNTSNHVGDGSSNYAASGSNSYVAGGTSSFRGRGGAGQEWSGASYAGDAQTPQIFPTDQRM